MAQAIHSLDFPSLVHRAYEDGARVFVELGPQGSCARMIDKILGTQPHAAKSACVKNQDGPGAVLRLLGRLLAERAPAAALGVMLATAGGLLLYFKKRFFRTVRIICNN